MKRGTAAFGYKAEQAVDLDTEIVGAADLKPAEAADGETAKDTVIDAQGYLKCDDAGVPHRRSRRRQGLPQPRDAGLARRAPRPQLHPAAQRQAEAWLG
jgi:hypothetical protein